MRWLAIGIAVAGLALPGFASPAGAASLSWGKAGVSFDRYRADAFDCSYTGLSVAVSQHSLESESPATADDLDDYLMRVRLKTQRDWHAEMIERQAAVDHCLTARGYRRFRLTTAQQAHLDDLATGTSERRQYLFSLGSDGAVLDAQGL